jgi:hypothetical protein
MNRVTAEHRPFYIDLDEQQFRDFARGIPLMEDEALMLESYARYAAQNDTTSFSTARITDFLLARGNSENIAKLKTIPNVRRLIMQTTLPLREKKCIDADVDGGEVVRIRLTDPARRFLEEYYGQMLSNAALPFPDEDMIRRYLLPNNHIDIAVSEISGGKNHRLQEEKRLILFRFDDVIQAVCASAGTIDSMLDVCLLKLRTVVADSAQNRLAEDLVKDMRNIMPQKTSNVERILRILAGSESEVPLYFVNLANRLAAYFTMDKDKRGMATLIQAARLVEAFKGYEAWLESEKNNKERLRENSQKLLNMMADYPALLSREGIIQKVVKGSSGLEIKASLLNESEIEQVVQDMISEYTVFQPEERELLPALLRFRINEEEFFIHREALLLFFESERKRVRAELRSRFRKTWYALMLRNESRSSMEFDEFFAEDVEKYVKTHEPVFTTLLQNAQALLNAFHITSRHPMNAKLQDLYFITAKDRVIFRPTHSLLELVRREIIAEVRAELPFLYRYPLLRWLARFFGFLSPEKPAAARLEDQPPKTTVNSADTDWHRVLHMIETRLIGEKNAIDMIGKYADLWNIKLGEARRQLSERVDTDIAQRAKRLYAMTRKLPEITQSFLSAEISNVATQIVRKYGNETADPRALSNYVQLSLIEQLKSIHS